MLRLLRIDHWTKNLFIFLPAFFGAGLFVDGVWQDAVWGFFAFSLIASAVYVMNDYIDIDYDRNHPKKKNRPLASGAVQKSTALLLLGIILSVGLALAYWLAPAFFLICIAYFIINFLYSLWLKHIAIVDISIIALGFLFRIFAGGVVTNTPVSNWLIVMTFLLAFFLGLAKRRGEYLVQTDGLPFRKALEGYNLPFLDASMTVCSTVVIVAYLMYCFSPEVVERIGSDKIYFTAIFVIIGILRYLQLTYVYGRTESPTRALQTDVFLRIVLFAWVAAFGVLLYL